MIPRVIARLDIKGEKLIKGIQLDGLKTLGNPNEFALKYYKEGIDEIFLVDIVASLYGRNNLIDVIRNSAKNIFIPIIVGGGIRSEDNAYEILKNGADKISLNTAAVENPKLVGTSGVVYAPTGEPPFEPWIVLCNELGPTEITPT